MTDTTPPVDVVDRAKLADVVEVPTDTCDTCGAGAYVYAMTRNGPVSYCAHHGTEYMPRLTEQAITIVDQRHLLNP